MREEINVTISIEHLKKMIYEIEKLDFAISCFDSLGARTAAHNHFEIIKSMIEEFEITNNDTKEN